MRPKFLYVLGGLASFLPASIAGRFHSSPDSVIGRRVDSNTIAPTSSYATLRRVDSSSSQVPPGRLAPSTSKFRSKLPKGIESIRNAEDVYFIVDITVENQTVSLWLDTGSSETWFMQDNYRCEIPPNVPGPRCGFGPGFSGQLPATVPSESFIISYSDGTFVTGHYVTANVTIAGITVSQQKLGLGNDSYWNGDGQSSGLIGLGYPFLTTLSGEYGRNPIYDPLFTSMWKQNLTAPQFTLALSRNRSTAESYLAFGGLPPVDYNESTWATTNLKPMGALDDGEPFPNQYGYYIIGVDAFKYGTGKTAGLIPFPKPLAVVLDVGSVLTQLPGFVVQRLYSSFFPPPWPYNGAMYAPCNATTPSFGVQIGGQVYYYDPADLLSQTVNITGPLGTWCRIEVIETDSPPYILGVSFFTNVVAVFDVGNTSMRFAARTKY